MRVPISVLETTADEKVLTVDTYAVWILTFVKQNNRAAKRYMNLIPREMFDGVLQMIAFCELKILQFVTRNLEVRRLIDGISRHSKQVLRFAVAR